MLILRSFWRKKNTKIYFIIFFILFFLIGLLYYVKNIFISLDNKNYEGSYIYFTSDNTKMKFKNIKKIIPCAKIEIDGSEVIIALSDKVVENNQILIPKFYEKEINIGATINYKDIEFQINGYYETNNPSLIFLVNNDTFNQISKNKTREYMIDLKVWARRDRTIKELEKQKSFHNVTISLVKKDSLNYDYVILAFNIFIYFLLVLAIILFFVTCFNFYEDEKKIDFLYTCLGFSRRRRKRIFLIKMISLFLFNIMINLIIWLVLKII